MEEKEHVVVQGSEREVLCRYGNGGIGKIEGVGTARLGKKQFLSPRDKIVGDLKSMGLTNKAVAKIIKGREPTAGECVSVGITAKDPKVMNYTDQQHEEIVKQARERLLEAVPKAVENFTDAVEKGDLGCSTKLLFSVGALESRKTSDGERAVEKFGEWLMSQRREVVVGEKDHKVHEPRRLITDANEIDDPVDGVRLTDIAVSS